MNRKLSKEIFIISKGLWLCLGARYRVGCGDIPANERNRLVMALADGKIGENKRKMWKTSLRCFILDGVLLFSIFIAREVHFAEKIAIFFSVSFREIFSKVRKENESFFKQSREQLLYLWQRRQRMENFWKAFKELSGEGIPKIIFNARDKKCKLENVPCVAYLCSWREVLTEALYRILSLFPTLLLTVWHSNTAIHIEDLLPCSLHSITNI